MVAISGAAAWLVRTAALLFGLLAQAVFAAEDPAGRTIARAVELAGQNELAEARQLLLDGRKSYPGDYRFARELAGVAYRLNDIPEAKALLAEALRIAPEDAYCNEFLGTLYFLEGNSGAALKYWNRARKPLLASVQAVPEPRLDADLRSRAFSVSGGQLLTLQRLRRLRADLDLLGIFREHQFDLTPRTDGRFDLTVRTTPRGPSLGGWAGRLLPLLRSLPYQGIHLDHYNAGGGAINITSLLRWDRQKRRVAAEISLPLAEWRMSVGVDGRDEIWDLRGTYSGADLERVTVRRAGGRVEFARNLTERLRWTVGGAGAGRQFRGGGEGPVFASGRSLEIANRFDYLLAEWPERRFRVDGWGTFRAGRIFGERRSRLIGAEGGIRGGWRPGAKGDTYSITTELRGGSLHGDVPLDERFVLGMERDTDVWLRGHVGTRDGRKGAAPLGTRYVLARSEAMRRVLPRVPIIRMEAGPFLDVGWAGDPTDRLGSRGWLYDAGIQGAIRVLGVQFSVVYGRNLRDGTGVVYTAVSR